MGHRAVSVMYLGLAGTGITSTDLSTLSTGIGTDWGTYIKANCGALVTLVSITATFIPSAGTEVIGTASPNIAGTGAGQLADAASCYVISWKTGEYYRGGHPRTYLPGPLTADISNGSDIASSRTSGLAANAASWLAAINARTTTHITGVQLGTVSYQRSNSWRTPPVFVPFQSVTVNGKLGNQRRRIHS